MDAPIKRSRDISQRCTDCAQLFNTIKKFNAHICGTLKCNKCPFMGKSVRGLNRHQRQHRGIQYKCNKCAFESKNPRSLAQHKRVHAGKAMEMAAAPPQRQSTPPPPLFDSEDGEAMEMAAPGRLVKFKKP